MNLNLANEEKKATRDGFGVGLVQAGDQNKQVVALAADLTESTRCHKFKEKYPDRFIETGICEQHLAGAAAGMAHVGKIPFACSFAAFNPGRNFDQIRVSVCYSKHNVKILGSHAGISVGEDGATHQALEDIAMMRVLPHMAVIVPCDAEEARKATVACAKHVGPVYLRVSREKTPVFTAEKTPFAIGKTQVFKKGSDVTIIACGLLVYEALLAADELEKQGISAEVLNAASIKPFDEKTLLTSVKKTGCVVSAEEHQVAGGLGGLVAEVLSQHAPTPLERVGMQDAFGESGSAKLLLDKYGFRAKDIVAAVKRVQKRKK